MRRATLTTYESQRMSTARALPAMQPVDGASAPSRSFIRSDRPGGRTIRVPKFRHSVAWGPACLCCAHAPVRRLG